MKIGRAEVFKKDYGNILLLELSKLVQKASDKQIVQLLLDHTHPSLNLEGITGFKGIFSVRVNRKYRMSLSFEKDDTIMLRRVLDHDDLYKNP